MDMVKLANNLLENIAEGQKRQSLKLAMVKCSNCDGESHLAALVAKVRCYYCGHLIKEEEK